MRSKLVFFGLLVLAASVVAIRLSANAQPQPDPRQPPPVPQKASEPTGKEAEEGNLTDAVLKAANTALAKDPDTHGMLFVRARAYYFKKDYANAEKDIDRALSLDPTNPLYRCHRLDILLRLKKPDAVSKEAERAAAGPLAYALYIGAGGLKLDDEVDELLWQLVFYPNKEKEIFAKLLGFKARAAKRAVSYLWYPPVSVESLFGLELMDLLAQLGADADEAMADGHKVCEWQRTQLEKAPEHDAEARQLRFHLAGVKVALDRAKEERREK